MNLRKLYAEESIAAKNEENNGYGKRGQTL